jgi:hypothetical protein
MKEKQCSLCRQPNNSPLLDCPACVDLERAKNAALQRMEQFRVVRDHQKLLLEMAEFAVMQAEGEYGNLLKKYRQRYQDNVPRMVTN